MMKNNKKTKAQEEQKNIEQIKIWLTLEFGKKISVNQKGNTPKLSHI
jgi:hypothetical protein